MAEILGLNWALPQKHKEGWSLMSFWEVWPQRAGEQTPVPPGPGTLGEAGPWVRETLSVHPMDTRLEEGSEESCVLP